MLYYSHSSAQPTRPGFAASSYIVLRFAHGYSTLESPLVVVSPCFICLVWHFSLGISFGSFAWHGIVLGILGFQLPGMTLLCGTLYLEPLATPRTFL